jgi:hypothetical protein
LHDQVSREALSAWPGDEVGRRRVHPSWEFARSRDQAHSDNPAIGGLILPLPTILSRGLPTALPSGTDPRRSVGPHGGQRFPVSARLGRRNRTSCDGLAKSPGPVRPRVQPRSPSDRTGRQVSIREGGVEQPERHNGWIICGAQFHPEDGLEKLAA